MREERIFVGIRCVKADKWKTKSSDVLQRSNAISHARVDKLFSQTTRRPSVEAWPSTVEPIFPVRSRFPESSRWKILQIPHRGPQGGGVLFPERDRGISTRLMDLSWRSRGFGYHGHGPTAVLSDSQISRSSRWRCRGESGPAEISPRGNKVTTTRGRTVGETIALKLDEKEGGGERGVRGKQKRGGRERRGEENEVESERRAIFDSSVESKTFAIQKDDEKGRKGGERGREKRERSQSMREEISRKERERDQTVENYRFAMFALLTWFEWLRTRRAATFFFNEKSFRTCYRLARSPYLEPDTSTSARIFPFIVGIFPKREILASECSSCRATRNLFARLLVANLLEIPAVVSSW